MANCACGTLKVVSNNKESLERLERIFLWEDADFFISGMMECESRKIKEEGDFYSRVFYVIGKWSCDRFFNTKEDYSVKATKDYEKDENGNIIWDKPIQGTAHLTNLRVLARELDFGCELFATEPDNGFCEHYKIDHRGHFTANESAPCSYDDSNEDGVVAELDNFNKFSNDDEIYGLEM